MPYTLYYLKIKNAEEIRYVGITKQSLNQRLCRHYAEKRRNPHKINWIKANKGNIEIVPIIENIPTLEHANILEQEHILKLLNNGSNLLNKTKGGDGTQGLQSWNKGVKCNYIDKLIANSPKSKKIYCYDLDGNYITEYNSVKSASKNTGCSRTAIISVANNKLRYKQAKGFQFRFYKTEKIKPVFYDEKQRIQNIKKAKQTNKVVSIFSETLEMRFANFKQASISLNLSEYTIRTYCYTNRNIGNLSYRYA